MDDGPISRWLSTTLLGAKSGAGVTELFVVALCQQLHRLLPSHVARLATKQSDAAAALVDRGECVLLRHANLLGSLSGTDFPQAFANMIVVRSALGPEFTARWMVDVKYDW